MRLLHKYYSLEYLKTADLSLLGELLQEAADEERMQKEWEAWLHFAPGAAITGTEIPKPSLLNPQKPRPFAKIGQGTDEDVARIRDRFNLH